MNNVHPLFASILSDVREATQTLTNCARKGKLQKDGTRMPIKQRSYDSRCEDLAEIFLKAHHPRTHDGIVGHSPLPAPYSEAEKQDLAQTIQDAIEDWFFARERLLEDSK